MNKIIALLLFAFLLSCNNNEKKQQISFAPKVTEAKGYTVPKDSVSEPKTISASIPITVKAGKPIVNPTNLNVHIAGTPKVNSAGLPKIYTPGTDTFSLPKTILAKGKTKPAGIPEVVIAKDAAAKDVNPANFSFYKTLQGLKHNTVRCMLQDKTGNLWFGTNGGGVCRYDGKSFTNFTEKEGLSNNYVWSILEDKTGNLWFGTNGGGVCRYDGKSFTNFTEKEGLSNNVVWSILEDKTGNLWFGTNGGVCRYDGKSFTNFTEKEGLSNNYVWSILEDKTGNLWFGTNGGVCRYDGKSFTNFTEKEGLSNNYVLSILEDKTGNLWFGTNGGGVCRYDGKSFTNFTEKEGLSNNVVWSILEDKTGNLWFGTNGGGVCRYDGKSFTNFTEKEGLSNNVVWSILEDKTGNLWFGTNGGVCRYDGKSFTNFTEKEGLSNNYVWSMLEDKTGNLWFGTDGGVCRYDGKSFTNFTEKEGLSNNYVLSILEDKTGNLWFGTNGGGVCRYDGKSFTNFTEKEGLSNNVVWSILEDKTGNLWFGTNGGVCRYDGKSFTNFTEKEGLSNNYVLSILEDKTGNLWFGTYGGGVCRYDGKSFTNFTEKEGLSNNYVLSILEDKTGNLWFGTNGGGVCRYDGKSFTNFTEKEGLSNNAVLNMMQDVDGNIWFGTRKGLSKVTPIHLAKLVEKNDSYNPIKEAFFYNYGYNDGFLGLNCRRNSVLQDSKGRIWWGTDVLTCYDPKGNIADTTAPLVNLTSIKLFGEEIAWANLNAVYTDSTGKEIIKGKTNDTLLSNGILLKDIKFDGLTKWYNLPEHLSLPYNNNNLTFNFIGVHMQSRNHIKYQYKLEGIDPDWSSITNRTEAPYGNLPSGDYIFKIKAMNQSGVWSEPFEYKFIVRPPWWQTWWFRVLVGLIIIGSIFYFIKSREKKLVAEKEKLEKTVEERTAEVVEQKHLIEEKHKEITDSINYAERIQRALLASKKMLDENLSDYFILFKPKDVVSGDFYWATKLNNNNFVLVTADSTGHGVPGAIMSILNIACLDKAVTKEIISPELILDETRSLIIEHLKNDGSEEGGKDGMDGSLLSFDFKNNILYCAAANNPVWIIRDNELIEIKADRLPIGKHDRDNIPFTLHTLNLQKGDVVYTLTDGFPDQFGGANGKKFKHKQLQNLLLAMANKPMETQKQKLNDVFDNWKGDLEQVDDVCLIGVRI
jgi:ligand-binding sensor domain-containing protein/serine phosphatase RsbU (regulator of sigma subunit)